MKILIDHEIGEKVTKVLKINKGVEEGVKELAFQDQPFLGGKNILLDLARTFQREKIREDIKGICMTAIPGILDD